MCFVKKSVKPLLYGDMSNEEFEEALAKCQRCDMYAKAGNLERMEGMSENDYCLLLTSTAEKCKQLMMHANGIVEKNILRKKLDQIHMWEASFYQSRVQGGQKEKPYSVGIFGGTSVGKSTIANVIMISVLMMNEYSAADNRLITVNDSDKFMSNYRSHINGVFIDDLGNTKPDYVERAPTALMIQLVNNIRSYANMAEAHLKGVVSMEPVVVVNTKNVKDGCASVYSNEPASITRREITITAVVKPEYAGLGGMLDSDKVMRLCPHLFGETWRVPDLWNLRVEQSFPVKSPHKDGTSTIGWKVVCDDRGNPLDKASLPEVLKWMKKDSARHFDVQRKLVASANNIADRVTMCPECIAPWPDVCECGKCPYFLDEKGVVRDKRIPETATKGDPVSAEAEITFKPNLGEKLIAGVWFWYQRRQPAYTSWIAKKTAEIETKTTEWCLERLDWLETSRWLIWTNWVPTQILYDKRFVRLLWWSQKAELCHNIKMSVLNSFLMMGATIFLALCLHPIILCLLFPQIYRLVFTVEYEKQILYSRVVGDNQAMPKVFKMYRDRHVAWITSAFTCIAVLYGIACVYKAFKVVPSKPQGNLAPTSNEELEKRDKEANPWAVVVSPMPSSERSSTMTVDQLMSLCQKNLVHMTLYCKDGDRKFAFRSNAFFICSNVALIPSHTWDKYDSFDGVFVRHDPQKVGGNFSCPIHKCHSYTVPGTDLCLVWIPNGGDWKNLSDYLPVEKFHDTPARLCYKNEGGEIFTSKLRMKVRHVQAFKWFFGATYDLDFLTFEGLCMAPLVTETKSPVIGGFHLGGTDNSNHGCSGLLLRSQLDDALKELRKLDGVLLSKSEGTLMKQQMGVQYFETPDVHPKSPLNFLEPGSNIKVYGSVKGRVTYYSDVVRTCISDTVKEVCGVPCKWGKPKFHRWKPWYASLSNSAFPSPGVEPDYLVWAVRDYVTPIIETINKFDAIKKWIRPLSRMENVCGIDGVRFIDPLKKGTSVGYPLSGPKRDHMTLLDPKDHPGFSCPAELDEIFWTAAEDMEKAYLAGERAYPIFKACLKDEPTSLDKDKVRVFQGAPLAMQLLVRKYFLPIARALSMIPLLSECAVGINAQGPEWDQLAHHLRKHGEENILAGDYSKYDLRMPAQATFAAFRVMIDIARSQGYSERDITIMEGIATDICYPLMAYNGDLIQHFGSNPSGQNLTVYINSIVNSLLFRCAFKHITGGDTPFREAVALSTYGDDAKSSVSSEFPDFNHLAVAEYLGSRGMKFTMPDKTSDPTPYMSDTAADFLKRKNIWNDDVKMFMGALDENSIFKSLHTVLKSTSVTPEQHAMGNIDDALREWFLHGREVYEKRRTEMQEVAQRTNLSHGCTQINVTYDEQLEKWKEKYVKEA